jgi:proline-specific peptidase
VQEGFVDVPGGRVWFQRIGEGGIPLLCLHGGPGFTHNYLEPLADLASDREVVFYDQLGCGRSDRPDDSSLWTVERSMAEVDAVRRALELERFHLFGNSWGGMLSTRYTLEYPAKPLSLLLSGTPDDMPRYIREVPRLLTALPRRDQDIIRRHEDAGWMSCPEYVAVIETLYKRHLCRLDPWPDGMERAFAELGTDVYVAMCGPSEFNITGILKDWDLRARLPEITIPVLVLAGRHDELSPEAQADMAGRFPDAQFVLLEEGSHCAFWDDRQAFMRAAADFLRRVDAQI